MLETPILVALVVLAIAAVAGGFTADGALELLRRTILNRVDPVTPLRIEFANRVNYIVRIRPR